MSLKKLNLWLKNCPQEKLGQMVFLVHSTKCSEEKQYKFYTNFSRKSKGEEMPSSPSLGASTATVLTPENDIVGKVQTNTFLTYSCKIPNKISAHQIQLYIYKKVILHSQVEFLHGHSKISASSGDLLHSDVNRLNTLKSLRC